MKTIEFSTEWKPIKEYEGLYEVSKSGEIRSLTRRVWNKANSSYSLISGCSIVLDTIGKKYAQVHLCKNGKQSIFLVHRIVAKAFVPNPNNLPEVNHKDCDKLNNHADNLEWADRAGNARHAKLNGRYDNMPRGTQKPGSKLNEISVRHIRSRVLRNSEYCKLYNVAPSTVSCIQTEKHRWRHVV